MKFSREQGAYLGGVLASGGAYIFGATKDGEVMNKIGEYTTDRYRSIFGMDPTDDQQSRIATGLRYHGSYPTNRGESFTLPEDLKHALHTAEIIEVISALAFFASLALIWWSAVRKEKGNS